MTDSASAKLEERGEKSKVMIGAVKSPTAFDEFRVIPCKADQQVAKLSGGKEVFGFVDDVGSDQIFSALKLDLKPDPSKVMMIGKRLQLGGLAESEIRRFGDIRSPNAVVYGAPCFTRRITVHARTRK